MLPGVETLLAGGQKALGLGALLPELQLPGGRVVDKEDGRSARPVTAQRHHHLPIHVDDDRIFLDRVPDTDTSGSVIICTDPDPSKTCKNKPLKV